MSDTPSESTPNVPLDQPIPTGPSESQPNDLGGDQPSGEHPDEPEVEDTAHPGQPEAAPQP